jgi:hypothetical protein
MDPLSTLAEIFRDLLIFIAAMIALLVLLIVVIATLRRDNPLKRLLIALACRVGATAAAGALAIPIEPIAGLDALYDIGAPLLLLLYWISFFKNARRTMSDSSARVPQPPTTIEHSSPPGSSVAKDIFRRLSRL